jgi:hypothetical protein
MENKHKIIRGLLKKAQILKKIEDATMVVALEQRTPILLSSYHDRGAIIHPSTKKLGEWQVSWWDTRGFSGDATRKTKDEAVKVAVEEGYYFVDMDGVFKKISSSPEFLDGV